MINIHSINLLRKLNLKLLVKITKLKKKNAEVKAENIEVKAENKKLRCTLKEHKVRFINLEQRNKEKINLIIKLDDDIRQKQNAINILIQSNIFIPESPIHSITFQLSISSFIKDYSNYSIKKNNADPISQNFDSISLNQTNIPFIIDQYIIT